MRIIKLVDAFDEAYELIEQRYNQKGVVLVGLPSGFSKLDELTGGFRDKAFYLLAGRTGMGKSSMALTMARAVADYDKAVLYHSLEMDASILVTRFLAGMTGLPALDIERGRLTEEQLASVKAVRDVLEHLQFTVSDERPTSRTLSRDILKYKETNILDFLVVDHLSLLTDSASSETERLEKIVGNVSALAAAADMPILGLAQLNREADDKDVIPQQKHIRYSDRISHDASWVGFVHRPYYFAQRQEGLPPIDEERDAKLYIEKNRFGGPGEIACVFHATQMRWSQFEPEVTEQETMGNDGPLARRVKEQR